MAEYTQFINDEQWQKLKPLLPKSKASPKGGRPPADNRKSLKAFSGYSEQGHDGRISQRDILAHQHVDDDYGYGKNKVVWLDVWPKSALDSYRTFCNRPLPHTAGKNKKKLPEHDKRQGNREKKMYIVHVFVQVKPGQEAAFKAAAIENASNSVNEPGIARFDVVQKLEDPTNSSLLRCTEHRMIRPNTKKPPII